ncbi:VOC family protein [Micromonospora sp. LZ34]
MTTTFINLPVRDLTTSTEFFRILGFTAGDLSPDGASIQLALTDTTQLMLHTTSTFAGYTGVGVPDTATAREVIVGLALDSREEVDDLIGRVMAAGAEPLAETQEQGGLYMRGFRDLDGHQWSFLHVTG